MSELQMKTVADRNRDIAAVKEAARTLTAQKRLLFEALCIR